ncbi:phosphotransferase [Georgenia phoenicis]|uniref:phosphotransferase family protein n=1 Tax=unclassified Georgenia TaxID=2626815 RepID=UPI0039B10365
MTDERTVRRLLADHGREAGTVRLLGAGLDHAAYEVDGELVVRLTAADGEAPREARLLRAVGAVAPLPVPVPLIVAPGCLAYRKLPGRPLIELPDAPRLATAVGAALGELLAVVHALPVEELGGVVGVDATPLTEWVAEARDTWPGLREAVPAAHRPAVEDFLAQEPPPDGAAQVLAHNDLGVEHVLVDASGRVTGVIDWSDAALTDPARDLGLIYRDLGPQGLDAALTVYGEVGDDVVRRAELYARCGALEDLAYGLQTSRTGYVTKTLRSLTWLFPTAATLIGETRHPVI